MRYNNLTYKYIIDQQLELAVTTATDALCTIKRWKMIISWMAAVNCGQQQNIGLYQQCSRCQHFSHNKRNLDISYMTPFPCKWMQLCIITCMPTGRARIVITCVYVLPACLQAEHVLWSPVCMYYLHAYRQSMYCVCLCVHLFAI